ncbi:hypothetical protein [Desulfonatronospira sp. MSAO_Bac3]|uniref:hypothetical protein n=1 Tax=Desulfonatronospira sp. MSAO_Bac3 TaxID=2293857 RepID=UPI00058EBC2A|nr:hypothetical protein [Desulfonatronospira sp. MSAO_Bac3]RQD76556.1 MAG: hypothetical protein D5S03_05995 [Desulfonatronospira sp. MSAO_Bac3]
MQEIIVSDILTPPDQDFAGALGAAIWGFNKSYTTTLRPTPLFCFQINILRFLLDFSGFDYGRDNSVVFLDLVHGSAYVLFCPLAICPGPGSRLSEEKNENIFPRRHVF